MSVEIVIKKSKAVTGYHSNYIPNTMSPYGIIPQGYDHTRSVSNFPFWHSTQPIQSLACQLSLSLVVIINDVLCSISKSETILSSLFKQKKYLWLALNWKFISIGQRSYWMYLGKGSKVQYGRGGEGDWRCGAAGAGHYRSVLQQCILNEEP